MRATRSRVSNGGSWPSWQAIAARVEAGERLVQAVMGAISEAASQEDLQGAPQIRSKVMRRQLFGCLLRMLKPDLGIAWPGGVFSEQAAANALTEWEQGRSPGEVTSLVAAAAALAAADPITFGEKPVPPPFDYFAFVNRSRQLARVHLASCPYCKFGAGVHHGRTTAAGWWSGPYSTYEAALIYAESEQPSDARPCKHCLGVRLSPTD